MMTQQLQQSIKLLQMSSQEVMEFVEQELEKNPLLSAEEEESDKDEGAQASGEGEEEAATKPEAEFHEESMDDAVFEGESYEPRIKTRDHDWEDGDTFESFTAKETSLRDFLLEQLNLQVSDPVQRIIGQHLIDLVDEAGYIKDDSSVTSLLDCPPEFIEGTYAILHSFEPSGVCARNLRECLAIQLRDKDRLDPAMSALLDHLDRVAAGDVKSLSKLCGVDADDIKEMCAEIRALNPRPGSGFQHEAMHVVIPDVFLRRAGDAWHVELNSAVLPRVLVNRRYYMKVHAKTSNREEKKYLSEQLATANWLVKALDSRAQTILKVASEIVKHQDHFFLYGIKYLRPLTLKEVADAVQLHESTVSRVTSNKFINTTRGTFEFKYFFNASIQSIAGGEGYSNKSVQYMIKELIGQETPDAILSDDAIAEKLKDKGIEVARRTVAKYRELMKIPSSAARKKANRQNGSTS